MTAAAARGVNRLRAALPLLSQPSGARWLLAYLGASFFLLYAYTPTNWYTFDSISYATLIRRFEDTGEWGWLFHPHHLLFNTLGWLFHCLLRWFEPEVTTLTALQTATAFLGAFGVTIFGAWVYEETRALWAALGGSVALGGSFGWWFGSTDGRANLAATALTLAVLYALRRAARGYPVRWCAAAGLLLAAACLLHQSHLLFLPIALAAAAITGGGTRSARTRRLVVLLAVFTIAVGVPYGIVLFGVKGFPSGGEAFRWITTYGRQDTWWSFDVGQNIIKDAEALVKALTGRQLSWDADGGFGWSDASGRAALALWSVLIGAACWGGMQGAWWRHRDFLVAPILAFLVYGAFFTVWDPGYFVHWFAQTAFLVSLFAVGWRGVLRLRAIRVGVIGCVIGCVVLVGVDAIAPRLQAERNPHLQLALRVRQVADRKGLVIASGMGGAAEAEVYIPYFARVQVLALHAAWARSGGSTARATDEIHALIDRVLQRGNTVHLLSEAIQDPGSLGEMRRRYGVSAAEIQAVFAPYPRVAVDRRGYVVIYRLLPRSVPFGPRRPSGAASCVRYNEAVSVTSHTAAPARRNIVVLGSTGSIGTQTLDIVRRLGTERIRVVGLAARSNTELLFRQVRETGARYSVITDPAVGAPLASALGSSTVWYGADALVRLATLPEADTVVIAVAGAAALRATIAAAQAGKRLCIATKEVLVAAGNLVTLAARTGGAEILPIDSEHSAIFQSIQGYAPDTISRLYLTASGGPFRTWTGDQMARATRDDALNHPTWRMGGKITVDSATLMNKGLEIIEASVLFGIPTSSVEVVVHPQSVVHSLVEMRDGALLAQLGLPDMRLPIQIALVHPDKVDTGLPRLRPQEIGPLTFEAPDTTRFPALGLARRAAETAGTAPAVLNAANEAAATAFLEGRIAFPRICTLVETALSGHEVRPAVSLDAILDADREARESVARQIQADRHVLAV